MAASVMNVTVLDSLTAPAGEGRTNEDAIGATSISAWVIDGATGLGDQTYVPDAASAMLLRIDPYSPSRGCHHPVENWRQTAESYRSSALPPRMDSRPWPTTTLHRKTPMMMAATTV